MEQRFLVTDDYYSGITKRIFGQISDNFNEKKIIEAEKSAKTCFLENMIENYKIEEAFAVGENIAKYNTFVDYPRGVYFELDGDVLSTISAIRGVQFPVDVEYWAEDIDLEEDELEEYVPYTQLGEWYESNKVVLVDKYYTCLVTHGYAFSNIRIPGSVSSWSELIGLSDIEKEAIEDFNESKTDYVIGDKSKYNELYFEAVGDVNFDTPELGKNIKTDDPRNSSIVKHMVRIALYELYKSVSPNNVSITILKDYENTLLWLRDCNKLKINPMVDRKTGVDGEGISTDWAIVQFSPESGVGNWMT